MASLLVNRLDAARRRRFVGRAGELALFQSALKTAELPFSILYIFGPGGVGKTTLLREFVHIATQNQLPAAYLDGRNLDPSPDFFLTALKTALDFPTDTHLFQQLANTAYPYVILIDTYETLSPLDGWLRDIFLPQLPGNVLMVLAGRHPPSLEWRTDPGWETMMHILPLRNLNPEESQVLLQSRQVPADQYKTVLDFTHGHPLALSLVADVLAQRPGAKFQPEEAPHVIKTLLEQFVQKVPGPAHRAALEACALVQITTESLLAAMLNTPDAHELFEWLRRLSFIESERHGIFPHDLAREALTADLRWRNPDWYAELHKRARAYYMSRLEQSDVREQRRVLFDYIYLHRDNPMVRPFFEWQEHGTVFTDTLQPADIPALLTIVQQHEGEESRQLAAYWFERQPQGVAVFRDSTGQAEGFLAVIGLHHLTEEDRQTDMAMDKCCEYLQNHAPLRPGEIGSYFRLWMSRDGYQAVSPVQSRIFLNIVQHYLTTPGLAHTFIACANADFWSGIFAYADLRRLPQLDFAVGEHGYGVYGHDWRTVPPAAWLALLAEREIATGASVTPPNLTEQLIVLSESDFKTAVRDALRDYTNPTVLTSNPLLQSRLIIHSLNSEKAPASRITALQKLLQETAVSLQNSPKQLKLYQALYHTYLQPAPTQEKAAELLDLPFSTYRRHLRSGIDYLIDRLWELELGSIE